MHVKTHAIRFQCGKKKKKNLCLHPFLWGCGANWAHTKRMGSHCTPKNCMWFEQESCAIPIRITCGVLHRTSVNPGQVGCLRVDLDLPFLWGPIRVRIALQRLLTAGEEAMRRLLGASFNLTSADKRDATTCKGYAIFVSLDRCPSWTFSVESDIDRPIFTHSVWQSLSGFRAQLHQCTAGTRTKSCTFPQHTKTSCPLADAWRSH